MNSVASFFAGIMAFIGSLFGNNVEVTKQSENTAIVEQAIEQATTTADGQAMPAKEIISTSTWKKYHSEVFGYEIEYPEEWTLANEDFGDPYERIVFLSRQNEDNKNVVQMRISIYKFDDKKYITLKDWVLRSGIFWFDDLNALKEGYLNGDISIEIAKAGNGCKEETVILRNGFIFVLTYPDSYQKDPKKCHTSEDALTTSASFRFVAQMDLSKNTSRFSFIASEEGHASGVTKEAIQKDFKNRVSDNFYETKSKIYFYIPNEKGGCNPFYVLNKNTKMYYSTNLGACADVPLNETLPYYIEVSNLRYDIADIHNASSGIKNIHVVNSINLETGEEKEIIKTKQDESLVAGYGEYDFPVISFKIQDKDFIKVGIYKKYTTWKEVNSLPSFKHEKLREEIVKYSH